MVNIVCAAVDHPDADSPLRWSLEVEVDSSVCRKYLSVEFNLVLSSRLLVAATENGMKTPNKFQNRPLNNTWPRTMTLY